MHVETGPNGEQIRKHAGQKRTYKAVSWKKKHDKEKKKKACILKFGIIKAC